jgi:hypothetical protein
MSLLIRVPLPTPEGPTMTSADGSSTTPSAAGGCATAGPVAGTDSAAPMMVAKRSEEAAGAFF